jgi:DNA-directed RNA polymerase specialized sigma subunit
MSGRPTKAQSIALDAESALVLAAYFDESKTTHEVAAEFGLSLRQVYRRVDRALKNRRVAARAEALVRMEAG